MGITQAVFVASFGQRSSNARRKAWLTCTTLGLLCIALGSLFAFQVQSVAFPPLPDRYYLLAACIVCVQFICLAVLGSSHGILNLKNDIMVRLLYTLPLPSGRRWLLIRLPQIILIGFFLTVIAPPIWVLLSNLTIPPWYVLPCLVLGSLSALGLLYGGQVSVLQRVFLFPAYLILEVLLLKHMLDVTAVSSAKLPFCAAGCCLLFGAIYSLRNAAHIPSGLVRQRSHSLPLPPSLWFVIKILRSYTGRMSLLFASLLCIGVASVAYYTHMADASFLCNSSAFLLASFTSDIRSLSRIKNPPEIVALRGTFYFARMQFLGCLVGMVASIPIIVLSYLQATPDLLPNYLQLVIGCVAGCFAATLLGSQSRDVTSQCAAVLISGGILFGIHWLSDLYGHSISVRILIQLVSIGLLLVATFCTEYIRNTFLWRKHYART